MLATSFCAWRAYRAALTEGKNQPSMNFFLDPSTFLHRHYGPRTGLSPRVEADIKDFWRRQDEYPSEFWVNLLEPGVRYVLCNESYGKCVPENLATLRLELTMKGWKATGFVAFPASGWCAMDWEREWEDSPEGDERRELRKKPRCWIRMW